MSAVTDEIAAIKADAAQKWADVTAKVETLAAQIAAQPEVSPEVQAALDDLKSSIGSEQVPA